MINVPVRKKKINVSRIVKEYEKSIASVEIKNIKKSFPVNTVEKELVLQNDFCFEAPETLKIFTEKRINVSSDSKGKTNGKFCKSQRTNSSIEDLKTISNKQMLT